MQGRMTVRITPDDVGRRVSVRSRTHGPDPGPAMTDAVGYLRVWSDDELVVERADGSLARVHPDDLLAGKVLPDPPPQRRARYPDA